MKKYIIYLILVNVLIVGCKQKSQVAIKETPTVSKKQPNVLFLLADDLGYGELGAYGQKTIKTPFLDSLIGQSMKFTNFYAGSAVCSPSRAVLMTGKSSSINTIRGNNGLLPNGRGGRIALRKDEITLGEMMTNAGYETAFVGKWHLGDPDDVSTWAHDRGFSYAVQEQWSNKSNKRNFDGPMEYINGMKDSINFDWTKWQSHDEYRTDLALKYLDKKENDKPFFLFMSYRAPHGAEKVIGNQTLYAEKGWKEPHRIHATQITLLDSYVDRLLKKIDAMGELDNTIIFFTSDNGPHSEGNGHNHEFFESNGVLNGFKRDVYEGGIRVPFFAYWKGKIIPGSVSQHMGSGQDFMPTLAEIVGIETPEQSNGISFLPALIGKEQPKHDYLNVEGYFSGKNAFRQSIRYGDLKGVRYGADNPVEIYDLSKDIAEEHNIADKHPELVAKIEKFFKEERTNPPSYPYGGLHYNKNKK